MRQIRLPDVSADAAAAAAAGADPYLAASQRITAAAASAAALLPFFSGFSKRHSVRRFAVCPLVHLQVREQAF